MTKTKLALGILITVLLALPGTVVAASKIDQSIDVPARFTATIDAIDCNALPGPRLTLQGSVTPNAMAIDVSFDHVIGSPDPKSKVSVRRDVVPANDPTPVEQQTVRGALGGDPFVWLQLTDAQGRALTSEMFLGRCSQGQFTPSFDVSLPAKATADVSASSCTASDGPVVALDGQVQIEPLHGKVIFRNSDSPAGPGPKPAEAAIEILILSSGPVYAFAQEEVRAGTGGNPQISTQFRLGTDATVGREVTLGRCAAIAK